MKKFNMILGGVLLINSAWGNDAKTPEPEWVKQLQSSDPVYLKTIPENRLKAWYYIAQKALERKDFTTAEHFLTKAASPDNGSAGYPDAQIRLGSLFIEQGKFDDAFNILEEAAKQNRFEAWLWLGKLYFYGKGCANPCLEWAKYCFLAAERVSPYPETQFYLGLISEKKGDLKNALHWMKSASAKGHAEATAFLADTQRQRRIIPPIPAEVQKNPLTRASQTINQKLFELFTDGNLSAETASNAVQDVRMITLPLPEKYRYPVWNYDSEKVFAELDKQMIINRFGDVCMMEPEFRSQPLAENLLYPNPTIRRIGYMVDSAISESLASYRICPKEEMLKIIRAAGMPIQKELENKMWQLSKDLYFDIECDVSGAWRLRDYIFIFRQKDGTFRKIVLSSPPGRDDFAAIVGLFDGNPDAINNFAVRLAEGAFSGAMSKREEAEPLFKDLVKLRHAAGTCNLAIYYAKNGKPADAAKYFQLAKEFAKGK